jgi:aerobic carbon-monoxide dehydrogenase medium subunit
MSFELHRPETLTEALTLLGRYGDEARVIAGGTALVLMINHGLIAPRILISLDRLSGLRGIERSESALSLGALSSLTQLSHSKILLDGYPLIAEACGAAANVRVRNQATLGGNLAEADYASDPPAALSTLNARIVASSVRGKREISIDEFLLGYLTTDLQADELITQIILPPQPPDMRSVYLKFRSRSSEDRPCVVIAAAAAMEAETCTELRLTVGAACETPRRLPNVDNLARGQRMTGELIAAIAEAYGEEIEPIEDLRGSAWYRTEMVRVHVRRALERIAYGNW